MADSSRCREDLNLKPCQLWSKTAVVVAVEKSDRLGASTCMVQAPAGRY